MPLIAPSAQDIDSSGTFVYEHRIIAATQQVPEHISQFLTESGDRHLLADITYYRQLFILRVKYASDLITELLSVWLSDQSIQAMDADPQFLILQSVVGAHGYLDSFAFWGLVERVHNLGSSRAKYLHFTEFLALGDSGLSLDSFLAKLRRSEVLLRDNFADKIHTQYISFDMMMKLKLIHGIDSTFYARPIERLMDEFPDATYAEAVALIHAYALERGSTILPLKASGSKVLLVQSLPGGPTLPPSNSGRAECIAWCSSHPCPANMCSGCWGKGHCDLCRL
jgi:hypothetical protein